MPGYTLADQLTLKNKLGAASHKALEVAETDYVKSRLLAFRLALDQRVRLNVEHLRAIHYHLFQDVYEWADRTRDERVTLSDGAVASEPILRKVDGNAFLHGLLIAETLEGIVRDLRDRNYLRNLDRAEFAQRAGAVMVDLNGVHPFREGNGRTQRVFMIELAREAGYTLDFSIVSRERMITASIVGHDKSDPSMMQRLLLRSAICNE